MRSCVVQVIIQRHGSMVTSTDLGLVFPCLYELFGGGVEMVRMQPGVGSVEQAQVRDQPELHFTITESLFKVFVSTLVPEKSVQYVAQFLASADLNCACARFCYSVSPWVTFQKF